MTKPFKIFLSIIGIWFILILLYGAVTSGESESVRARYTDSRGGVTRVGRVHKPIAPFNSPEWELWEVTAYANDKRCVGKWLDGHFALGKPTYWGGCAADKRLRFGTIIEVRTPIRGRTHFKVEDRGGAVRGKHIDIFLPDEMGGYREALNFGRQKKWIKILN